MYPVTREINEKKEEVLRLHSEIRDSIKMSLVKAIRIGELLTEIKKNTPYGDWGTWIEENLPNISQRTAERYMAIADPRFIQRIDSLSILDLTLWDAYKLLPRHPRPKSDGGYAKFMQAMEAVPEAEEANPEPIEAEVITEVGSDHELIQPEAEIEPEVVETEVEPADDLKPQPETAEEQVAQALYIKHPEWEKIEEGTEVTEDGKWAYVKISDKLYYRAWKACNTLYQRNMNSDKQRTVVTLTQFVSRAIIKECNRVEKEEAEIDHGLLNRILSGTTTDEDFRIEKRED
jgi:hypothetical protein